MDKAPEKLWMTAEEMGWPGSFRSFRMSDLEHPEDEYPAYVRADLYEQVKRELEDWKLAHREACDNYSDLAAERLAGARVKALDEDDYEEITNAAGIAMRRASRGIRGQVITVQDSFDWWVMKETERRILSALTKPAGEFDRIVSDSSEFVASLSDSMRATGRSVFNTAEPAGEAEPSKWTVPGSSYAGATTPPDASAIREALVEIANGCSGRVDRDHLACRIASAALTGAKP